MNDHVQPQGRWSRPDLVEELRARVWAWDPVGLVPFGVPEDEYDCFIDPITAWLQAGATPEMMADGLNRYIASHFETPLPADTLEFARAVVEWAQTSEPNPP
jgi:hypothetical protein